jgi:hypothetical protein
MAAVVAFSKGPWLAGPVLCAAMAGLYWPHLRTFAFSRVAINAASMGLAAGAAASVFHAIGVSATAFDAPFVGAGVLALVAFWFVNSTVLGVAVGVIQDRRWWSVSVDLVRSDLSLLPFAVAGLIGGYLILRSAFWVGWLTLLPILLLVDLVVIRRSVYWFRGHVRAIVVTLVVTAVFTSAWVDEPHVGYALLVIVGLAVVGVLLLDRARTGLAYGPEVVCLGCAAVEFHRSAPLFAPLVVGLATSLALPICGRRTHSILGDPSRAALAALAVACAGSLLPAFLGVSLYGSLLIGLASGLAAVIGWHAVPALSLVGAVGRNAWRPAADLVLVDAALFVTAGLGGALCGWASLEAGLAGLTASLCVVEFAMAMVSNRRSLEPAHRALTDAALEDVVRSALLDLPASRLPDDL